MTRSGESIIDHGFVAAASLAPSPEFPGDFELLIVDHGQAPRRFLLGPAAAQSLKVSIEDAKR